ncbi:MAG: hypothetical protein H7274_15070 [Rhodoferax sp.]|nr:hypothetical protein [Rhodoferax sp.]
MIVQHYRATGNDGWLGRWCLYDYDELIACDKDSPAPTVRAMPQVAMVLRTSPGDTHETGGPMKAA